MMAVALTIAGSDSGGGAGIQADLKTLEAHGVFGTSALTAITAQNTLGVQAVEALSAEMVKAQIQSVLADFPIAAIKTGMLANAAIIEAVAAAIPDGIPLVVDPVMVATSGDRLLAEAAEQAYTQLLSRATLITPNLPEAAVLLGSPIQDRVAAAQALAEKYGTHILLKGGHAAQQGLAVDILHGPVYQHTFAHPYLQLSRPIHGTGCTLSAAIAARLSLGERMDQAVEQGIAYLQQLLQQLPKELGKGSQPLKHSLT